VRRDKAGPRDSKESLRGEMVTTFLGSPARFGRREVKGKEEVKLAKRANQ
jgi:hypothetical protein